MGNHCLFQISSLIRQFGSSPNCGGAAYKEINRIRQYGDMTNADAMNAIRAKYPPTASLTYRDIQLMFSERVAFCWSY